MACPYSRREGRRDGERQSSSGNPAGNNREKTTVEMPRKRNLPRPQPLKRAADGFLINGSAINGAASLRAIVRLRQQSQRRERAV